MGSEQKSIFESELTTPVGVVILLKGIATATDANNASRPLKLGDSIFPNDIVKTGLESAISLELANGKRLDLGRESSTNISADITAFNTTPDSNSLSEKTENQQNTLSGQSLSSASPNAIGDSLSKSNEPSDEAQYVHKYSRTGDLGDIYAGFGTRGLGFNYHEPFEFLGHNNRDGQLGLIDAGYETKGLNYGSQTTTANTFDQNSTAPLPTSTPPTYFIKLVATDSSGNILPSSQVVEGENAYYKAILVTVNGTEVTPPAGSSIDIQFIDQTATQNSTGYSATSQTVLIGQVFSAAALDDNIADSGIYFDVQPVPGTEYVPANATINVDPTAVTTTIIDDTDPTIPGTEPDHETVYVELVNNASQIEDNSVQLIHQVRLVDDLGNPVLLYQGQSVTVNLAYSSDTTSNADFSSKQTSVTITGSVAGVSSANIINTVTDDAITEGNEAYTLSIGGFTSHPFENIAAATVGGNPMTVTGTIVDDETPAPPTISGIQAIRVSEEGLTDGLTDTSGNSDTTDSVTATGNFTFSDINSTDTHSYNLSAPVGSYTSNGKAITWTLSNGNQTLTGSTSSGDVLKVDIDDTGAYTTTLLGPIDQSAPVAPTMSAENEISLGVGVIVTDNTGRSDSTTLNVIIEDDSPQASSGGIITNLEINPVTTNLIFTLDVSGSMSAKYGGAVTYTDSHGNPVTTTRFELAKQALLDTIDEYEKHGSVNVNLTLFNGNAVTVIDWQSAITSETYINSLGMDVNGQITAGGTYNPADNYSSGGTLISGLEDFYTNHEDALNETVKIDDSGLPTADKNVAYYLSDGEPTKELNDVTAGDPDDITGANSQDGVGTNYLDDAYLSAWTSFISGNNIELTVLGIGSSVTTTYLNAIQIQSGKSAVMVTRPQDLSSTLTNSVDLYVDGDLTVDTKGNALIHFGADGGHLNSVTIAGNTVTYNAGSPTQTVTGSHGDFAINFDTGAYRYTVTDTNYVDHVEVIQAEILDNDGDLVDTILLNINISYDVALSNSPQIADTDTSVVQDVAQTIGAATDSNGAITASTLTATNGTAVLDGGGNIIYTPNGGYLGGDVVQVSVTDNDGNTSSRYISVDVITAADNADTPTLTMTITETATTPSYEYRIDLDGGLSDFGETLSDITLANIPSDSVLQDSSRTPISANPDGTYTVTVDANGDATAWIVSPDQMITAEIDAVSAQITSTQPSSGDTSTVEVKGSGGTATIIDGIIEGLFYETTSGISGFTDADGNFDYLDGDTVVFKLGNLVIGDIDTGAIRDGKIFLQDLADVERTDLNDEYVENMAVLLQSLDENNDAYDGIVITDTMHHAFSDDDFDLTTISEQELRDIIEQTGRQAISEEDAMVHVQDMLEEHAGIDEAEFEQLVADELFQVTEQTTYDLEQYLSQEEIADLLEHYAMEKPDPVLTEGDTLTYSQLLAPENKELDTAIETLSFADKQENVLETSETPDLGNNDQNEFSVVSDEIVAPEQQPLFIEPPAEDMV